MDLLTLIAFVIVLIFSIVFHEVAHGYVAYKFGDTTAKDAGRLTLNPIPHIDLIGTILLPGMSLLFGFPVFGWAKPVPVNLYNLHPRKLGNICVSLAGIATNLILAVAAAMVLRFSDPFLSSLGVSGVLIGLMLLYTVIINLVLGLFNLVPIPPLDGSRLLTMWLPKNAAAELERYWFVGLMAILVVVQFLPLGRIIAAMTQFLIGSEFVFSSG